VQNGSDKCSKMSSLREQNDSIFQNDIKMTKCNSFREIVAHVNLRECGLSCDNGLFEHITLERVASC
jgi:hypothetical protein